MSGSKKIHGELTTQQEAFAIAYAETGNAAKSYRQAYNQDENARDGWIYVEASQLLDHPKVALRIKELQAEAAKMALYSVRAAYDELEAARKRAEALKQPATEVSAIAAKIKLFGLDQPTKIDHTTDGKPLPPPGAFIIEGVKPEPEDE